MSSAIVHLPARSVHVIARSWGHIEIRTEGDRVVVHLVLPNGGIVVAKGGSA